MLVNRLKKRLLKSFVAHPSDLKARIRVATSCHDSENIPKVPEAGQYRIVNGENVQIMHNGLIVLRDGYYGAWMSDLIAGLKGCHEPQEEKVFHEILQHLPEDAAMLECGCYWAYYSLWFLHQHPKRRALLIEPSHSNIQVAIKNATLNNLPITVEQAYISGSPSTKPFIDWDGKAYEIPGVSLDSYMTQKGLDHLSVVHADIQGAEDALLAGGHQALSQHKVDYFFISTHDNQHSKCLDILKSYGYSIMAEHDTHESFSTDGFIAAAGKNAPWRRKISITKRHYFIKGIL